MEHPFGAGLMFFLTGGPMGGGGAGMLARLGGRQLLSNGARVTTRLTTRLGAQAMKNLVSSGVKNMVINTSTQLIFNGGRVNELDMADIAISGVTKNFAIAAAAGSLVNLDGSGNFSTGFSNPSKGLVDLGTGLAFGYVSGQVGFALGAKNIGGGYKNAADFTINLYQGLFNYTLSRD